MVHGDLKPENVFLSDPDPNSWRLYPTIKMADFDGSRITNAADPGNPGAFWGDAMTDGYISTEQWLPPWYGTPPPFRTDVPWNLLQPVPPSLRPVHSKLGPVNIFQIGKAPFRRTISLRTTTTLINSL